MWQPPPRSDAAVGEQGWRVSIQRVVERRVVICYEGVAGSEAALCAAVGDDDGGGGVHPRGSKVIRVRGVPSLEEDLWEGGRYLRPDT